MNAASTPTGQPAPASDWSQEVASLRPIASFRDENDPIVRVERRSEVHKGATGATRTIGPASGHFLDLDVPIDSARDSGAFLRDPHRPPVRTSPAAESPLVDSRTDDRPSAGGRPPGA